MKIVTNIKNRALDRKIKKMHSLLLNESYTKKIKAANFFGQLDDKDYIEDLFTVAETCPRFVSQVAVENILKMDDSEETQQRLRHIEENWHKHELEQEKIRKENESKRKAEKKKIDIDPRIGALHVCKCCHERVSEATNMHYYTYVITGFNIESFEVQGPTITSKWKNSKTNQRGVFHRCNKCEQNPGSLRLTIQKQLKKAFETLNDNNTYSNLTHTGYKEALQFQVEDVIEVSYDYMLQNKEMLDNNIFKNYFNPNKM